MGIVELPPVKPDGQNVPLYVEVEDSRFPTLPDMDGAAATTEAISADTLTLHHSSNAFEDQLDEIDKVHRFPAERELKNSLQPKLP